MTAALRWGILGAARIARTVVAPALHAAGGAELAALATRDPVRAGPFHAIAPGLRVHASYDALLSDPEVDAVYIPLPNHLHVEWTLRALDAGKHVLCEKPIALGADEIDRLIAARDRTGLTVAEAFMVVHHPQWLRARTLLGDGAIGPLRHVAGAFSYRNTDPDNIRNRPETGGGAIRDIGVYPVVTTRFVTAEEPHRVQADLQIEGGVDTYARVWADFDGFDLAFYVGMRHAPRQEMVFHGETGWLRLTAPFNARIAGDTRLDWRGPDGTLHSESHNAADQYQLMAEAFARSVRDGAPFACPLEFSRGNQAMIDAILAAGMPADT